MSAPERHGARAVLVTGAGGLVGRRVVARLAAQGAAASAVGKVVALDVRPVPEAQRRPGVVYETGDIRDPELGARFAEHGIETVVHLAAVVTPGKNSSRQLEYEIDVRGTENVLRACVAAGVRHLVYTSSGAAYGYHADAPAVLDETQPLRGNREFAYADHKRQAEEILARHRAEHPELAQLVLRPGTILGDSVASPISALFERPVVFGVRGAEAPFVLVWDEDVAECIVKGVLEARSGIYNLTGDGAVPLREIARRLGKPYLPLPAWLLAAALRGLHALGLAARGAEQVDFLRHRPVLSNEKLKHEFGFVPLGSKCCFERWRRTRFPESLPLAGPPPRVVAVTGGAAGIGAALCRRLARAGARVAVLDRDGDAATAVADELTAEGHEALALTCDVTEPRACQEAVDAVVKHWNGLDVLVANAGVTHLGRFADTQLDVIRRVMEVNFFGAVQCAKAALPRLLERRGTVVVLGSVAGLAPLATRTGYAASKHALHGFFESLRTEHLDDGLTVLLVDPSFVDTAIGEHALGPDGRPARPQARTGVDHPVSPEAVAEKVLRALCRGRSHLYVPWRAALYVWLARLAPAWFARTMARRTAQR